MLTADVSRDVIERIAQVLGWTVLGYISYATLCSIGSRPHVAGVGIEHFAAFAALGLSFALAYPRRPVFVVLFVVGSAIILECLQMLTPDRHAKLVDAVVKMAGGLCGVGVGALLIAFFWAKSAASPR